MARSRATPHGSRAGAGRADVVLSSSLYPLDGFTGEHDPLAVRVLLLDDGNTRISIVVVDLTSIADGMITSMKAILAGVAGVAPDHAIVCAGHSFATPHVFVGDQLPPGIDATRNESMRQAFEAAMRAAATLAVSSLQAARLGFGRARARSASIATCQRRAAGGWARTMRASPIHHRRTTP